VSSGLDVMRADRDAVPSSLRGRRIGLITNHTGLSLDGTPTLIVLADELGLDVVVLFSPEHGFTGDHAAGDEVASGRTGSLTIESLYGATRKPTPAMLAKVDTLVFDIQDIGTRFYTYISTMKLAMEAAAAAGVSFVVLDRPNPLGGLRVEGPVLDPQFSSFVGIASIPLVHGMTTGELAKLFQASEEGLQSLELDVVRAQGWSRRQRWTESGMAWVAPSPNIRTAVAALVYPAVGLIEGINVSEGRGTSLTFERLGAPWIESEGLARAMNDKALPGVFFEPVRFTPRRIAAAPAPKYADMECSGVSLRVDDPTSFEAVRTGLELVATIRALYPERFSWVDNDGKFWMDRLLGTNAVRLAIDRSEPIPRILAREEPALRDFVSLRARHLLYR